MIFIKSSQIFTILSRTINNNFKFFKLFQTMEKIVGIRLKTPKNIFISR